MLSEGQLKALLEVRAGKAVGDIRQTKFFKHERDPLVFNGLVRFADGWRLTPQGRAALVSAGYGNRTRRTRLVRGGRRGRLSRFASADVESAFDRAPDLVKHNVVLDVQEMARFELGKHITFEHAKTLARTLGQRSVKSIYYVSARQLRKLIERGG